MRRMWFDSKWLGWMEAFVFISFIFILVNGSSAEDFNVSRDLYRGDPLSLFIFLLAAEGLADLIHNVVDLGEFHGFHMRTRRFSFSNLLTMRF